MQCNGLLLLRSLTKREKQMKIHDELTGTEIITPSINLGYLYPSTRFVEHIDDKEVVMEKTVSKFAPDGLKQIIPGHDMYEDCLYY